MALQEEDLSVDQASHVRQPSFLVDAFAAVHALVPALFPLPGSAAEELAGRLARLAAWAAQQPRRYPPAACLQPACKALHALLAQRVEGGGRRCCCVFTRG